jgi:hypothetical protein
MTKRKHPTACASQQSLQTSFRIRGSEGADGVQLEGSSSEKSVADDFADGTESEGKVAAKVVAGGVGAKARVEAKGSSSEKSVAPENEDKVAAKVGAGGVETEARVEANAGVDGVDCEPGVEAKAGVDGVASGVRVEAQTGVDGVGRVANGLKCRSTVRGRGKPKKTSASRNANAEPSEEEWEALSQVFEQAPDTPERDKRVDSCLIDDEVHQPYILYLFALFRRKMNVRHIYIYIY